MSLVDKIIGKEDRGASMSEYEELDLEQYEDDIEANADTQVHIAELRGQEGVMDVKEMVYDGDMVIADISYFKESETRFENVLDDFRQVADEVGGDIVQKGDNQIILTPRGVKVNREKIAR
ncbi:MAG: cell division protein SepF [Halobacteria archaeon]|nr:cell division protein SepF [Halobacteria archaeon]